MIFPLTRAIIELGRRYGAQQANRILGVPEAVRNVQRAVQPAARTSVSVPGSARSGGVRGGPQVVRGPAALATNVAARVIADPKAAARDAYGAVKEIGAAVRAGARGFEDEASGGRANRFYATAKAKMGLGGEGDFDQRYERLLKEEEALDAKDRREHPTARQFGRDLPAFAEFELRLGRLALDINDEKNRARMHQLLTNRPVEHVRGTEALVPLWGSSKEFVADYQDGDYVGAGINAGLAASDVFLAKALATAGGKAAIGTAVFRQPKKGLLQPYSWHGPNGVSAWMRKTGQLKPGEEGHHWLIKGMKRKSGKLTKLEHLRQMLTNQPWNIVPANWPRHRGFHGDFGVEYMGLAPHLWFGTPQWAKMAATQGVLRPAQQLENLDDEQ